VIYTKNGILVSLKKKGNPDSVTAWVNLRDKMLNEINQTKKDKCWRIPLT
jgi:hypothetical protein